MNLDRIGPGPPIDDLIGEINSTAFVFCAVWLLPALTAFVWLLRRRSCAPPLDCGPAVLLLAGVALPTIVGFVRTPTAVRIPDAFGTAPMLAAWLVAATFSARPTRGGRALLRVLSMGFGVAFAIAIGSMAHLREKINQADLTQPPHVTLEHGREILTRTRTWPWTDEWPAGGGRELVPYLNRCTAEGDRLLVLWNAPQFNVFSRRAFAGGETLLVPVFRDPHTYEAAVVDRLRQQSVPIVLADSEQQPEFRRAYPAVSAYLASRYQTARVFSEDDSQQIVVLVDRERRPVGIDPEFNLPCFGGGAHTSGQGRIAPTS